MPPKRPHTVGLLALVGVLILASPAAAQRLPVLGGLSTLPATVGGITSGVTSDLRSGLSETTQSLDTDLRDVSEARLAPLRALVRANPEALELDAHGAAVVRGEVLAIAPTPQALDRAAQAGFSLTRRTALDGLDLEVVVLAPPSGVSAREALRRLRKLDPTGQYDLDHLYSPSGEVGAPSSAPRAATSASAAASNAKIAIGMLDSGVAADHPALAGDIAAQQGFAPGGIKPAAHGTAVASLIVGHGPDFRGAAPGARLYVADVYGAGPTGGSADAILRALAWMAQQRVSVVNVSLVGPPNLTLQAGVRALTARGVLIVAPVGNDGPAAPPLFPASYPGVIAVTAVDARGRLLPEAGHASHVDFAALGADVPAARFEGGFAKVRGTSFAAPVISGRLALLAPQPGPAEAARAVAELSKAARPSHGPRELGHGIIEPVLATAQK